MGFLLNVHGCAARLAGNELFELGHSRLVGVLRFGLVARAREFVGEAMSVEPGDSVKLTAKQFDRSLEILGNKIAELEAELSHQKDLATDLREDNQRMGKQIDELEAERDGYRKQSESFAVQLDAMRTALETTEKAMDMAVYDLERIRDADWSIEQARLGARSGAHVANENLTAIRAALHGEGK